MRSAGRRALLGLALALLGCGSGEPTAASPEADGSSRTAPDFTLPDLGGNPVSLADFRGKVVVVDFWATWCPPCVFQVPELNKLANAHREAADLVVLGVSVDVDGVEVVAPWIEEQGVDYTILMGDEKLAAEFGAVGFPTLAVITADGRIHSLHVGLIEYDALEELVAPLLPPPST